MATGLKRAEPGFRVTLQPWLSASMLERLGQGVFRFRFDGESSRAIGVVDAANQIGSIPLPPYIEAKRRRETGATGRVDSELDKERYQTVYARDAGAVAAPTAGLHFTDELLEAVQQAGHEIATVTLHVGPGTFRPVEVDDPSAHKMDAERYEVPSATAGLIRAAKAEGRPVVAVGTTVVRTLEAAAQNNFEPGWHDTDLYIMPGYEFSVVTELITNFHLPRSTLLMLVSALAGRESMLDAYREAVQRGYMFYSYGDAMFIKP